MENDLNRAALTSIAFVFNDVLNYESLVAAFRPGVEVHVLDAGEDGLAQIAAALAGRSSIGSIHIVGHGAPGVLQLGSLRLDASSAHSHAGTLAAIGSALEPGGDILLYGCDVASGAFGARFVGMLALATGADVAASTDATGGAQHGGDWTLEFRSGEVSSESGLDAASVHDLDALLALPAAGVKDVNESMNKSGSGPFISGFTLTSVQTFEPDPTEGADGIYFFSTADASTSLIDATFTVTADNINLGNFDLTGLDLEKYPGGIEGEYTITVTGYKGDGSTVVTSFRSERDAAGYSTLPNFSSFTGITKFDVRIQSTGSDAYAHAYPVSNWTFDGFTIASPHDPNTAPVFVGSASLSATQNTATDVAALLHVSDIDGYQTLTWSQHTGPSHGTLSFSGATASGGGSDIAPGGSITYTPATGYVGTDSFTVKVWDGYSLVTRTINVSVAPSKPSTPDLAGAMDTGVSSTDNITKNGFLTFTGTGAAGDSASTVRVFLDVNGNGAYDAGTDVTNTATMSNGSWTVSNLNVLSLADGTYNAYAVTTSGASTSALSTPLSVTIDKTAPTVAITSSKSSLKAGETATITFTFSEDPGTTFTLDDTIVSLGTLGPLSGTGTTRTATFTPTPNASGTGSVTVGPSSYTDAAGNSGSSGSLSSLSIDTLAPTLAITSDKSTLKIGQTATITFTFSEDPGASFVHSDITVSGGTISAISGTGTTRTATFTPSGDTNGGVASITVASGAYTDAAGNSGGAGSTPSITFDTLAPAAPTLALSASSDTGTSTSDGVSSDTTPTFTGTAEAGATVALYDTDGTTVLGSTTADGSGNWSITSSALSGGTHLVSVRATDAAGNQGVASAAYAILVDTAAPTLTITSDVSTLDVGDTATITFTFSEDPGATFTADDITVSGGTLGSLSGTGNTRTAVFTPAANSAGTASITVSSGSYTDAAGNAGGAGATPSLTYDTTAPTLAITSSASTLKGGETATITFTFSVDPGSSFTHDDIAVSGGTLGPLSGSGLTRTATFTPDANTQSGSASITVAANAYDDGTNGGLAAGSPSITFDTLAPTLAITSDAAVLKAGEVATITFTFSEDPGASFTDADIAVTGGTIGAISGTGTTRTATFTPDASTNGGVASISVASGQYTDAAGNAGGAGTTPSLTFDTLAPAASSVPSLDSGSDTGTSNSDNITSDTTPTVSGTAEDGATVTLYDGATVVGSAVAAGGMWSITSSALAAGGHALTTTVTDAAGNVSSASAALNITVDTSAPTLAITSDASQLKAGETATITFTFNEDPGATFDLSDVVVSGGTLGALSGTGLTRTATFTPTPDTGSGSASITVAAAAYTDAAGNAGGEGTTPTLTFDTLAPQVLITSDVPALKIGEIATITFTFSEDPGASFTDGDIAVTGGTLGALSGTGSTRTATFTPNANTNGGVASITITSGAYTDAAGNGGSAGATPSLTFDTLAPSASSIPDLAAASDTGTSDSDDLTTDTTPTLTGNAEDGSTVQLYDGATLIGTATAAGGSWSITSAVLAAGAHSITAVVTDAAGNSASASGALALTVDTAAPTLAITSDVPSLKAGETATVTFTFSEDPGATFTADDVTVSGGTLAAITGSGNTRTAVFTPSVNTNAGTASITVASGLYTDAAGNAGGAGTTPALTFDTLAPAASSVPDMAPASDSGMSDTDNLTSDTTPTVTGTAEDGATVTLYDGATVVGTAVATGGAWSITTSALSTGVHSLSTTVTDAAGNVSGASAALDMTVDTAAPTLAITSDSSTLKAGETATITFTFNEDPGASFTADDIVVSGGTLGALSGSGLTRTATFTPTPGTNAGNASVTVAAGTYTDAAGNEGGPGTTPTLTFDTLLPSVAITADVTALKIGEVATITFTFSEDPGASLTADDIAVTGGSLGALSGTGTTRTATFTPTAGTNGGVATITIGSGAYTDAAGNVGSAGTTPSLSFDTLAPAASSVPDLVSASDSGTSATDDITSDDTPTISGTAEDGATVTLYDGATVVGSAVATGGTWSITSSALATGGHSLTTTVTDAAGNVSSASAALNITIDTSAPALAITSDASQLKAGETATITFTFSEDPGTTFDVSDVVVSGGTLGALSGSGLTRTATFTPTADTATGSASITVAAGSYTDAAGNAGGQGTTPAVTFDTLAPQVVISSDVPALKIGEVATITFTFSEDPGASFTGGDIAVTGGTLGALSGTGSTRTATFTPDANTNGGVASITVTSGAYTDAAGNGGSAGATPSLTFDTLAPSASSTPDLAAASDSGTSDSDNITSDTAPTFTGTAEDGATVTMYDGASVVGTAVAAGGVWSITSSVLSAGAHALTTTVTDAAGNVSVASGVANITVDTAAPTLAITSSSPALKAGETATITFSFSEDPGATFTADDITVTGGTLGALSGTGTTRTATFTPAIDTNSGNASITVAAGQYTDAAGHAGAAGSSPMLTFDTLAPTLSITSDTPALKAGEVATITFTFSEDPGASFALADITVAGGTLSALAGSGNTRTATFTPAVNTNGGTASISVAAGNYTDAAGNSGSAGAAPSLVFDTLPPVATAIDLAAASDSGASDSDDITADTTPTFTGIAENGATVTLYEGATVLGTAVASAGTWSITSAALADGVHNVTAAVTDAAGNTSTLSAPLALTVDTAGPTLAITSDVTALKTGETATVTFTFSEDPGAGFSDADIVVAGGTLGALSGTGTTRTATFTPSAGSTGTASVTVAAGAYTDAAGNSGSAAAMTAIPIDTLAPTLTISSDLAALKAGQTATITFSFSEDPGASFTAADIAVTGGTLGALSGSGTTRTATFTPDAGTNGGMASISVASGLYTDAAGNGGVAGAPPVLTFDTHVPAASAAPDLVAADDSGTSNSDNITSDTTPTFTGTAEDGATVSLYDGATLVGTSVAVGGSWSIVSGALSGGTHAMTAVVTDAAGNASAPSAPLSVTVDTGAPTVAITSSASALRAGQTATITFTFSEDPGASFTDADLAVSGGTLGALSGTGTVRTATFTPAPGSDGATATISLAAGLYGDAAGNTGAAGTLSVAVDTSPPAAPALSLLHDSGTPGDRLTSSGVVQVSGIEAGAAWEYSTNGGTSWTPGTGSQLTLSGNGMHALLVRQTDSAGNTGPASAPLVFTLDSHGPTASVSISDSALTTGESATVTITFDEAVEDFSLSDITAPYGSLSGLASTDGGMTWTATYTPDVGALSPDARIVVSNAGVSDAVGNSGSGTSSSGSFSVQTAGIGASIQVSDSELLAGETAQVTIVFNEAVTGFTSADLTAASGSLSNLSSSDGGKTWTATLTPAVSVADATNVITLDYSGVFGQAGLPGTGAGTSGNYSVNTVRPTAMLALADTMLAPGESTQVTITFSEPVAGFSFADMTVLSGTLSGLSSADGGRTWTTILTADQGTAKMGGIALNVAGVQSMAGNAGTGMATTKFYMIPANATPASVDGAQAYYQQMAGSNGAPGQVIMVVLPPAPDRSDDPTTPNGSLADIPLGLPAGDGNSLMVGLPAGTGLQANGPSVPLSQPQALADLIGRIENGTQGGSATQQQMAAHGSSFLGSLGDGVTVETRTLTLSADAGANPGTPIAITGAAPGQGSSVVGLVIDGSGLPAGSTLQLDNVEFAAVVGDVRLVGGAGRNYVVGDGGSQTIYLGAEDDSIFGGAGNDIIGSAGGDDLLDGGDGDDLVAGGIGNDSLVGGGGDDVLNGGRSTTGSWDFYLSANGAITARHTGSALTLTGSELVAAAEFDPALSELAFLGAHAAQVEAVALLYAALGRAPDVAGLSFWSRTGLVSLRDVADGVLRSAEWGSTPLGQSGDAEFVRGMYQDLLGREVDDAGFAFWTANLVSGRASRSDVLMAVAFSGEHKDKALTADGYLVAHANLTQEHGWISNSGDDRLDGGAGNDLLVGGDGFDTAVYAGRTADYEFVLGQDGLLHVVHLATGDTDILSGIEAAEFADGTLEVASLVGQVTPAGEG